MSCLSPWQSFELNYLLFPETIVLFLATYGFIGWLKTKKILGLVPPPSQTKVEEPTIVLPDISNALPPPEMI